MRYASLAATVAILSATPTLARSVGKVTAPAAADDEVSSPLLSKRVTCGEGIGSCPTGQCCSGAGYCGTTTAYCKSPACQLNYSNGTCDSDKKPCGTGTEDVERNNDGNVPYGTIIKTCVNKGEIALTFDDGPDQYTEDVLAMLAKYDAEATFFISGNNNGKGRIDDPEKPWAEIIRKTKAAGHQIASHGWSHLDLSAVSAERREMEVRYNEMALRNILGLIPKYLRPPGGSCTAASGCLNFLTGLGYHVVNWDIDTLDYANDAPGKIQTSKNIFDRGVQAGGAGHIALSHDTHEQTAHNLTEFMLQNLAEKGYKPVTLGQCLGETDESMWYTDASGDADDCLGKSKCKK